MSRQCNEVTPTRARAQAHAPCGHTYLDANAHVLTSVPLHDVLFWWQPFRLTYEVHYYCISDPISARGTANLLRSEANSTRAENCLLLVICCRSCDWIAERIRFCVSSRVYSWVIFIKSWRFAVSRGGQSNSNVFTCFITVTNASPERKGQRSIQARQARGSCD
jgi:hypothetical protein